MLCVVAIENLFARPSISVARKIADRREFFNDDVNAYNTRIRQVPEVFLANLMALKPRELFTVSEEDRKLVEVGLTKELGTA